MLISASQSEYVRSSPGVGERVYIANVMAHGYRASARLFSSSPGMGYHPGDGTVLGANSSSIYVRIFAASA